MSLEERSLRYEERSRAIVVWSGRKVKTPNGGELILRLYYFDVYRVEGVGCGIVACQNAALARTMTNASRLRNNVMSRRNTGTCNTVLGCVLMYVSVISVTWQRLIEIELNRDVCENNEIRFS